MKGSRHRLGGLAAYQNNLPRSTVREGDTVTVGDTPGIALKKNYLTSEWMVKFPGYGESSVHESRIESGALFSVDSARDWPWGRGENDNYMRECCSCKNPYRGHKRSTVCCKCQRESDDRWASMTIDERLAHTRHVEKEMAKFCEENIKYP
tara:strand:- start:102 stop:554 length:453 start_codon:yes stop_codon:yes gene_type:complete